MITQLYIKNFALIDELHIDFKPGFSTITGETGAGKSIILGALGLALGARADLKSLKNSDEKAVVELTLQLEPATFKPIFESEEIDFELESIFRREILPGGKSRAFVNDSPVKIEVLSNLAQRLVDVHSQHDNILLRDQDFQLFLMDRFAENQEALAAYKGAYQNWQQLLREQQQLVKDELTLGGDWDYLNFLSDELTAAQLKVGEDLELEQEIGRLSNQEESLQRLSGALQLLDAAETGVLPQIAVVIQLLRPVARFNKEVENIVERLESVQIELKDVQSEMQLQEDEGFDPVHLEQMNQRLTLIQNLLHKHRVEDVAGLMERQTQLSDQLFEADRRATRKKVIEAEIVEARAQLENFASNLRERRQAVAPLLANRVNEILAALNMKTAALQVELTPLSHPKENGMDAISFDFAPNKGMASAPLHKIASGGEISRVTLALKAILSESKQLPTIIFDEVDTGISGDTAGKVARILQEMGRRMQVVAITHLPQIAAAGNHQYKVYKTIEAGITTTQLALIPETERVEELSRLLGGNTPSDAAKANAVALLAEFSII
jgi:DNA repair protein RecN (Recombination protein N)